jgi:hypothetical protein
MRLILTIECELLKRDIQNQTTVIEDLISEVVAVKSGIYENILWGTIASAEEIIRKKKIIQTIPRKDL